MEQCNYLSDSEIMEKFPISECANCDNEIYEDGVCTCRLLQKIMEGEMKNDN